MTAADWRALIGAYLDGRIGADALRRRFLEAFEAAVQARAPTPRAVQQLYYVVEAYAGDPMARGHAVSDDSDLRAAAQIAFDALAAETAEAPAGAAAGGPRVLILEPVGPEPGRADARRMAWSLGAAGGLGCAAVAAYVLIGVAQFFAVAAQIDAVSALGPAPSTLAALVVAFIPLLGGVVAFFGAKDVWGWSWPLAAALFLLAPTLTAIGGWRAVRRL